MPSTLKLRLQFKWKNLIKKTLKKLLQSKLSNKKQD